MNNPFSLSGKTIMVTGANSGIGAQCAIDCAAMGARVMLVARNEERLQSILQQMPGEGHQYYVQDLEALVDNPQDAGKKFMSHVVEENGKLDGLVHAAGVEKTLPLKLLKSQDYRHILDVNTLSAFELVRQCSNKSFFNDGGHIVLIASITAVIGRSGTAAYAASKGAMVSAIRSMVPELARKKITINCISPGTILTPLMQNFLSTLSEEDYTKRVSGFPLGLGETRDISNACVYLLSDAARWITGQNIIIDGGYTSL